MHLSNNEWRQKMKPMSPYNIVERIFILLTLRILVTGDNGREGD